MTHTYTLTRWDLLRTQIYGLSRNRMFIGFLILMSTLLAFLIMPRSETAPQSFGFYVFFIVVFDAMFVTVVLAVTIVVLLPMILLRKHLGVLGQHTLEITPDGLRERTEFNEGLHRWQGIHKVARTRHYLYVWVTEMNLHCVPIRSFISENAADYFQRQIETRRTESKQPTVAASP